MTTRTPGVAPQIAQDGRIVPGQLPGGRGAGSGARAALWAGGPGVPG
jgi:hypothetical protein